MQSKLLHFDLRFIFTALPIFLTPTSAIPYAIPSTTTALSRDFASYAQQNEPTILSDLYITSSSSAQNPSSTTQDIPTSTSWSSSVSPRAANEEIYTFSPRDDIVEHGKKSSPSSSFSAASLTPLPDTFDARSTSNIDTVGIPKEPKLPSSIYVDMLCQPVGNFNDSSGECLIDTFCSPMSSNEHSTAHHDTLVEDIPVRYYWKRGSLPQGNPSENLPGKAPQDMQDWEIVAMYSPIQTDPPFYPPQEGPYGGGQLQGIPPHIDNDAQAAATADVLHLPLLDPSVNFESEKHAPLRSCRIPKVYGGICHPLVIPIIVITSYMAATSFLSNAEPAYLFRCCFASKPPDASSPAPQYSHQNFPDGLPPQAYYDLETNDNMHNGSTKSSRLISFSKDVLRAIFCCCGGSGDPNVKQINTEDQEIGVDSRNACYYLTTFLTFGAGLIILGAFLGGLCDCVKAECEFV
ncbi:hypothetical protein TWF481_005011 [Arthrobotrys musiformis]|uniref:Uncharacterized protein n=1 Tax=Arthrobotrys musiformis TaxID=47236 RepID=A0AAV9WN87_9PEZI